MCSVTFNVGFLICGTLFVVFVPFVWSRGSGFVDRLNILFENTRRFGVFLSGFW